MLIIHDAPRSGLVGPGVYTVMGTYPAAAHRAVHRENASIGCRGIGVTSVVQMASRRSHKMVC